jgi:hypothetical protein
MIRTVSDVVDAYSAGRWHSQRFIKTTASQAGDWVWQDWSFSPGQPAYDARIGSGGAFNPFVAVNNDAVFFPGIEAGMERKLVGMSYRPGPTAIDQLTCDIQVYDLLGVYPMIDGDSTDTQILDNSLTLPRYADGVGVQAVLVNHVAPSVAQANFTINYTSANGSAKTMTGITTTNGVNKASWNIAGSNTCPLYLPRGNGCAGIRRIDDITFSTAPGGLWCLYLVKPMMVAANRPNPPTGATGGIFSTKCACLDDSFSMPTVYDGAHLGFFFMPNGASRTDTFFGTFNFIWG